MSTERRVRRRWVGVRFAGLLTLLLCCGWPGASAALTPFRPPPRVVVVSLDGLRPDAITALTPEQAPSFHFLLLDGASTLNARSDPSLTLTLPNHTCMLTGRYALGSLGHGWLSNDDPTRSLHANKGSYVAGVFDVVHDHGMVTALFASKVKFSLFTMSWEREGAGDEVPPDDGAEKLSIAEIGADDDLTLRRFLAVLGSQRPELSFVHLADADTVGHAHGWDLTVGSPYINAVINQDARLGRIIATIRHDPVLAGNTVLVVTSDHGGVGGGHSDPTRPENYTVPFLVWGRGVEPGADLYALNPGTLTDPGTAQVPATAASQPLRNGHVANLVTQLLRLPAVPGATIGTERSLVLAGPPPKVGCQQSAGDAGVGAAAPGLLLLLWALLRRGARFRRGERTPGNPPGGDALVPWPARAHPSRGPHGEEP